MSLSSTTAGLVLVDSVRPQLHGETAAVPLFHRGLGRRLPGAGPPSSLAGHSCHGKTKVGAERVTEETRLINIPCLLLAQTLAQRRKSRENLVELFGVTRDQAPSPLAGRPADLSGSRHQTDRIDLLRPRNTQPTGPSAELPNFPALLHPNHVGHESPGLGHVIDHAIWRSACHESLVHILPVSSFSEPFPH